MTTHEFKVQGDFCPSSQSESRKDSLTFSTWHGEVPMWVRTFMAYTLKIWYQWLIMRREQNDRGIPGVPEHREINPDDGIYFLTEREYRALVHAGDYARFNMSDEVCSEEERFNLKCAIAKLNASRELNYKEEWMEDKADD